MVNAESGWQKLAEIGRFLSRIAGIVYRKERINCCVFTITSQCKDKKEYVVSMACDWKSALTV
jgi:hypothetical protein